MDTFPGRDLHYGYERPYHWGSWGKGIRDLSVLFLQPHAHLHGSQNFKFFKNPDSDLGGMG